MTDLDKRKRTFIDTAQPLLCSQGRRVPSGHRIDVLLVRLRLEHTGNKLSETVQESLLRGAVCASHPAGHDHGERLDEALDDHKFVEPEHLAGADVQASLWHHT